MATTTSYNKRSSAVKRILSEARELRNENSHEYAASPLEDNLFEWHFTLRGPSGSEFEEGIYHGRIILPAQYPFRPPHVMVLTPNGRWELNKKICLTFTGFHEEMWQPAWGIRTALVAVQAFMGAKAEAAVGVGSLDHPRSERERLAKLSCDWKCPVCDKTNAEILPAAEQARAQEALPDGLTIDPTGGKTQQNADPDKAAATAAAAETAAVASSASLEPVAAALAMQEEAPRDEGASGSRTPPVEQQPAPAGPVTSDATSTGAEAGSEASQRPAGQSNGHAFGSEGPSTNLLAQMVGHARVQRNDSITSSQVTTPGAHTPSRASAGPASNDEAYGTATPPTTGLPASGSNSTIRDDADNANARKFIQLQDAVQRLERETNNLAQEVQMEETLQRQWRDRREATASGSTDNPRAAAPPIARAPPGREEVESVRRLATLDRAIATVVCLLLALFMRRILNTTWSAFG